MSTVELTIDRDDTLSPAALNTQARLALNKVITAARTVASRKTTETYRLSTRQVLPYITARKVSASAGELSGSLELSIKPISIEAFKPRVVMKTVSYTWRGRTVTRRLATIEVQRFVDGAPKLVGPAFPLTQRRTGLLRAGEQVRRRIGKDRNKLTRIRYYTFPRKFVAEQLAPAVQAFAPERFAIELLAARRFTTKGRRVVRA